MRTPGADIEQRINRAASVRLANAIATLGGIPVLGIFEKAYAVALEYGSGNSPVFMCDATAIAEPEEGDAISIVNGGAVSLFTGTVSRVQPDGTGWIVMHLQEPD